MASFKNAVDVEDYNGIRVCSSTEDLTIQGFISN